MTFQQQNWFTRPTPYVFLLAGVISLFGAVFGMCTGKTWARFHGWVYRAEEPNDFWTLVAAYYLGGVIFVGLFLIYVSTGRFITIPWLLEKLHK